MRLRMATSIPQQVSTTSCMRSIIVFSKPKTNTSTTLPRKFRRRAAGEFTALDCRRRFLKRCTTKTPPGYCESRCDAIFNLFVVLASDYSVSGRRCACGKERSPCPPTKRACPIRILRLISSRAIDSTIPYVLRENLTSRRANHDWRAIYLENEYLKCSVLPDIGGHLYTCVDKISGKSMFYANPSIKKAAIGYRGAWAAFGIEFNFPVSHNWVTMSPVRFRLAQQPGRQRICHGRQR